MKILFLAVICICLVYLVLGCGNGGVGPLPSTSDDSPPGLPGTPSRSEDVYVSCDILGFTESVIDDSDGTESLSVHYTIEYMSNFKYADTEAFIVPSPNVTEADIESDVYDDYSIGSLAEAFQNMSDVTIDFSYYWNENRIITRMAYKQATRDDSVYLNDEFEKVYLLVLGRTKELVSPTEIKTYRTWCVVELPLQKW